MTRSTTTWPLSIVTACLALGGSSSVATRLFTSGQVGVGLIAAGAACVSVTSIIAIVDSAPSGRHAPAAICALIVAYSFVTAFSIPLHGTPAVGHQHHGGHEHAASST